VVQRLASILPERNENVISVRELSAQVSHPEHLLLAQIGYRNKHMGHKVVIEAFVRDVALDLIDRVIGRRYHRGQLFVRLHLELLRRQVDLLQRQGLRKDSFRAYLERDRFELGREFRLDIAAVGVHFVEEHEGALFVRAAFGGSFNVAD